MRLWMKKSRNWWIKASKSKSHMNTLIIVSQPEWYMQLQAVLTPEKSTNVRLVLDLSSKGHDGLSLNDHLEKGPNYINSLPNVRTAWHWDEVAYSGDICKMFNQVLVHLDDQVFHRLLWRKNPHDLPTVYQCLTSVTNQLLALRRMPSKSWPKLHKMSFLKQRRNSRNAHMSTALVDPGQPVQRPSMSLVRLTRCLGRVSSRSKSHTCPIFRKIYAKHC